MTLQLGLFLSNETLRGERTTFQGRFIFTIFSRGEIWGNSEQIFHHKKRFKEELYSIKKAISISFQHESGEETRKGKSQYGQDFQKRFFQKSIRIFLFEKKIKLFWTSAIWQSFHDGWSRENETERRCESLDGGDGGVFRRAKFRPEGSGFECRWRHLGHALPSPDGSTADKRAPIGRMASDIWVRVWIRRHLIGRAT